MNSDPIQLLADILRCGAILLPVSFLAALLLRGGSAAFMRRFWRCTLVAVVLASLLTIVPPSLTFTVTPTPTALSGSAAPTSDESEQVVGSPVSTLEHLLGLAPEKVPSEAKSTSAPPAPARTATPSFSWPLTLALLWLAGVCVLLVRKLVGGFGVARLRRSSHPIDDPPWNAELQRLTKELGIAQPIELRSHLALRSPIVTGSARPISS